VKVGINSITMRAILPSYISTPIHRQNQLGGQGIFWSGYNTRAIDFSFLWWHI